MNTEEQRNKLLNDDLLDQITAGDQAAFGTAYEILLPQVYQFLRSRMPTNEDAEDLAEHVFIKVWKARKKYDKESASFRTWVFVIARRSLIDWYRTRKVDASLNEAVTKAQTGSLTDDLDKQMLMSKVHQGLSELDRTSSEIIRLRYLSELSTKEVADILSLSESAVRVRLHRAMKVLKEIMSKEYEQIA